MVGGRACIGGSAGWLEWVQVHARRGHNPLLCGVTAAATHRVNFVLACTRSVQASRTTWTAMPVHRRARPAYKSTNTTLRRKLGNPCVWNTCCSCSQTRSSHKPFRTAFDLHSHRLRAPTPSQLKAQTRYANKLRSTHSGVSMVPSRGIPAQSQLPLRQLSAQGYTARTYLLFETSWLSHKAFRQMRSEPHAFCGQDTVQLGVSPPQSSMLSGGRRIMHFHFDVCMCCAPTSCACTNVRLSVACSQG